MFFACLTSAAKGFRLWQTHVGVALFLLAAAIPSCPWLRTDDSPLRSVLVRAGSLIGAQLVFVLSLWPSLLGTRAPLAAGALAFVNHPLAAAALLAALFVLTLLLPRLPVFGEMHAFQTLLTGGPVLAFIAARRAGPMTLWPGAAFALSELLLCAVVYVSSGVVAVLLTRLFGRLARGREVLLILYLAAASGFLPLFVYGAWLGGVG
jgi:hypothetical protein